MFKVRATTIPPPFFPSSLLAYPEDEGRGTGHLVREVALHREAREGGRSGREWEGSKRENVRKGRLVTSWREGGREGGKDNPHETNTHRKWTMPTKAPFFFPFLALLLLLLSPAFFLLALLLGVSFPFSGASPSFPPSPSCWALSSFSSAGRASRMTRKLRTGREEGMNKL